LENKQVFHLGDRITASLNTLVLVLFIIAWAAIAFAIVRGLTIVWTGNRRIAGGTGVAVAAAFALGAVSPFALPSRGSTGSSAPPAPPAVADTSRGVVCPAGAVVGSKASTGHLDTVAVGAQAPLNAVTSIDVAAGSPIQLGGWIVLDSGPATAICAIVDGHVAGATARYGIARPDVATALQKAVDTPAGFVITLKLSHGSHAVSVGAVGNDGRTVNVMLGGALKVDVQ
jgi:hypothetical protein